MNCYQFTLAAYPELIRKRAASHQLVMFLLGLAPDEGYLAVVLLRTPVVSYTTISPSPKRQFVSVARSSRLPVKGVPAPGVTRHHALWSADFPRHCVPRSSGQPGNFIIIVLIKIVNITKKIMVINGGEKFVVSI